MSQLRFACPNCSKTINAPEHLAGTVANCPGCETAIEVPGLVTAKLATRQRETVVAAAPAQDVASPFYKQAAAVADQPVAINEPLPPPIQTDEQPLIPPKVIEVAKTAGSMLLRLRRLGLRPSTLSRIVLFAVYYGPFALAFLIAAYTAFEAHNEAARSPGSMAPESAAVWGGFCMLVGLAVVFAPWLLIGIWPARLLARYVPGMFYWAIYCPSCGEKYPLVMNLDCGCGYRDHRERNIITARCPQCKAGCGSLNCACCGCTILL